MMNDVCPENTDAVLRVLVSCHKHCKSLSARHDCYIDDFNIVVGRYEDIMKRALTQSDDQVFNAMFSGVSVCSLVLISTHF